MSDTSRLNFIALLPPDDICDRVTAFKQEIASRYDSRKALNSPPHVTLQPPFEWEPSEADALDTVLSEFAAYQAPVPIALEGFGAFPPKVLFVHVQQTPDLLALQPQLYDPLNERLGITARNRYPTFEPHVTIALRDLSISAFDRAWPQFRDRPFSAEFVVPKLTRLEHDGTRWQVAAQFEFSLTEFDE